jgi:hypothetical protein
MSPPLQRITVRLSGEDQAAHAIVSTCLRWPRPAGSRGRSTITRTVTTDSPLGKTTGTGSADTRPIR